MGNWLYRQISEVRRTARCLDCPGVSDKDVMVPKDSDDLSDKGVGEVHESRQQGDVQESQELGLSSSNFPSKSGNIVGGDCAARDVKVGAEPGPS